MTKAKDLIVDQIVDQILGGSMSESLAITDDNVKQMDKLLGTEGKISKYYKGYSSKQEPSKEVKSLLKALLKILLEK